MEHGNQDQVPLMWRDAFESGEVLRCYHNPSVSQTSSLQHYVVACVDFVIGIVHSAIMIECDHLSESLPFQSRGSSLLLNFSGSGSVLIVVVSVRWVTEDEREQYLILFSKKFV